MILQSNRGQISTGKQGPKGSIHSCAHCSTVHNSQDMEATECPSTEERIKMWHIYTAGITQPLKRMSSCHLQRHGWPEECHTTEEKHCVASLTYLVPRPSLFPGVCSNSCFLSR